MYDPSGMKLRYSYILIALTIIFFGLQYLSILIFGSDIFAVLGAKINELILNGEIWRFLTIYISAPPSMTSTMVSRGLSSPTWRRPHRSLDFPDFPLPRVFSPGLPTTGGSMRSMMPIRTAPGKAVSGVSGFRPRRPTNPIRPKAPNS